MKQASGAIDTAICQETGSDAATKISARSCLLLTASSASCVFAQSAIFLHKGSGLPKNGAYFTGYRCK